MTDLDPMAPKPELSRCVHVENLGLQDFTLDIEPSAGELKALGERLKIDSLDALSGHASLKLLPTGDVLLRAAFTARVTQTCVVTLEPVSTDISSEITTTYTNFSDDEMGHDEEEFADLDDDIEPSEPIVDGKIDVGEAIAEHLALEIDPFPRVKGATFNGYSLGANGKNEPIPEKKNPFAVLSKLKETPKSSK